MPSQWCCRGKVGFKVGEGKMAKMELEIREETAEVGRMILEKKVQEAEQLNELQMNKRL